MQEYLQRRGAKPKAQPNAKALASKSKHKAAMTRVACCMDEYDCPFMPRRQASYAHRQRNSRPLFGFAARPVRKDEIASVREDKLAMDEEFGKLSRKDTFGWSSVAEARDVAAKARRTSKKMHVGRVFGTCVEKGSELPKGSKGRNYKGRYVFQGNDVRDEYGNYAVFQ